MPSKRTVTPYEEQLEKQVHELEELVSRLTGEITPHGQCAYCGNDIRFLVRYNSQALVSHLQCPTCSGPHQLPTAVTLHGYYAFQR